MPPVEAFLRDLDRALAGVLTNYVSTAAQSLVDQLLTAGMGPDGARGT